VTNQSVCAIIVTYHPTVEMLSNVPPVLNQVNALVVVDNGSTACELAPWQAASKIHGFELIQNAENRGIAEALNQGVHWAQRRGFPWVLLFDQDSKITDGYLEAMFTSWKTHSDPDRVASMHPLYKDTAMGVEGVLRRAEDGGPIVAMTSGALMPTWIFDKIGMFRADYFVDEVDTEYCFRIRAAGYLLAVSPASVLLHHIGHPRKSSFLGLRFTPTHHSALRRYYMSRNRLVVYKKYIWIFPRWVLQSMKDSMVETAKCFLGEENRGRKLRNFLLGTWDGLRGRMGKRENL
jgi:rhamnosyltransferase